MKSTHSDLFFFAMEIILVATIVKSNSATPILPGYSIAPRKQMYEILHSLKSESDLPISKETHQKTTGINTCLRMAPDLPPCNFDSQATWRSTSGEIFHGTPSGSADYQSDAVPEFPADQKPANRIYNGATLEQRDGDAVSPISLRTNLEEIDLYENDLATTVVYYLEGCLPSRLPFNLPSCPVAKLRRISMNKLVPFKLPNVEDALIFPDIDVKQIKFPRRQTRTRPVYSNRQEIEAAQPSGRIDKYHNESTQASSSDVSDLRAIGSSLRGKEGEGGTEENYAQAFQTTITRNSISPMTGIATTKYARKLSGSGHATSISSVSANQDIINNNNNNNEEDNNPENIRKPSEAIENWGNIRVNQ